MAELLDLEEIKKAKTQITEGSLTVWNARLDAFVRSGDTRSAIDQLIAPAEHGDNCDCGCGADMFRDFSELKQLLVNK